MYLHALAPSGVACQQRLFDDLILQEKIEKARRAAKMAIAKMGLDKGNVNVKSGSG